MLIHTTGSSRDSGDDLPFLRKIIQSINESGATVAHNWVETSILTIKNQPSKTWDWKSIVSENLNAIERADLVIVEVTSYAFFQGYQIAAALQKRKPVLAVSRQPLEDLAIAGIADALLVQKQYKDEAELGQIVSMFIADHAVHEQNKKLAISVDVQLNSYLSRAERYSTKSRDELLRDLIREGLRQSPLNDPR